MSDDKNVHPQDVTRRVVLRGAAMTGLTLPVLAACGGGSGGDGNTAAESPEEGGGTDTGSDGGSAAGVTVAVSEVPVGGGRILADDEVVVTQPTEGSFAAFSAVCTHQGCVVGNVSDGTINCPCHGSMFSIEDGSVTGGPAPAPLESRSVSVEGDQLTIS